MSLNILYSDSIERLAENLKKRLLDIRSAANADPFHFVSIAVPNTNIAKWLQIRVFSQENRLCAGIQFPFIEQSLLWMMRRNLSDGTPVELLPDHAYANAILRLLLDGGRPELAPFRSYIAQATDGGAKLRIETQKQARMAWQLADKLASLMDQYEVRRPDIVNGWLGYPLPRGASPRDTPAPNSVEAGEAALARALWSGTGIFPDNGTRLSLRQMFQRVQNQEPKGSRLPLFFFGFSTLTQLQARILAWLARKHDVYYYHNNPCLEYWGDIETNWERRKNRLFGSDSVRQNGTNPEEDDSAIENPLLRQWGVAGRETLRLFVDIEEENAQLPDGEHVVFRWEPIGDGASASSPKGTVLRAVQNAIAHRVGEAETRLPQDASLQIIGTPGLRREVEMVYNAILGSVWMPKANMDRGETRPWPPCNFSDIAVLVPDMRTYRPVIEAVFDARGEIPYGLIDTTASEDSQYLAGFLALADFARKGLTRETLFAVLENPCVQKALGFSRDDVAEWRDLTATLGAFDGFDAKDGEDGANFRWGAALSRLRLARVADTLSMAPDDTASGDLPLMAQGGNGALLFSEVVERLQRELVDAFFEDDGTTHRRLPCSGEWQEEGDARSTNWAWQLERIADAFLAVPDDEPLESSMRTQIRLTLDALRDLPGEQDFELVVAAVEHFAGGISSRKGGYLTHGVTIAGLQPMRPVPFKQVFVLGLGEGGFPGRTQSSTLDIRGAGWHLGDVSLPVQNRYLFLETFMSVRDRLVLSYPNRDIEKDAELFPSGLIQELEEFVSKGILNEKFKEFQRYPLLEHGERTTNDSKILSSVGPVHWDEHDPDAGLLPTYSEAARLVAQRRAGGAPAETTDAKASELTAPTENKDSDAIIEISARELAEFIKSPMRAVLRYRFGIEVEGYRDREISPDSPLGIPSGPPLWDLQAQWLESGDIDAPFRDMQNVGGAPTGFLGDFAKAQMSANLSDGLRAFAAGFGVPGNAGTHVQSFVAPTSTEMPHRIRYTAATPNWRDSGDGGASVLVTGAVDDRQGLPSDRTLVPFIAFLMDLAYLESDAPQSLRIGIVDITKGKTASWTWSGITRETAREYLNRLAADYLEFLNADAKSVVDVPYRKLVQGLGSDYQTADTPDWDSLLEALGKEDFHQDDGKEHFNNDLVIAKTISQYLKLPSAEELADLFEKRYRLPLSGLKD